MGAIVPISGKGIDTNHNLKILYSIFPPEVDFLDNMTKTKLFSNFERDHISWLCFNNDNLANSKRIYFLNFPFSFTRYSLHTALYLLQHCPTLGKLQSN